MSRTFSSVKLFQFKDIKFKGNFLSLNKINVSTSSQKVFYGLPIGVGQK